MMRKLMTIRLVGAVSVPLTLAVAVLPSEASEVAFPALPETQASTQSGAQIFREVFQPGGGERHLALSGSDDSFCVLSGIQGKLRGRSIVQVKKNERAWTLDMFSSDGFEIIGPNGSSTGEDSTPFAAGSVCVPKSSFITDEGGVFEDYPIVFGHLGTLPMDNNGCTIDSRDYRVQLHDATATSFISHLDGDLGSFADYVTIEDPASALDNRMLHIVNTQCRETGTAGVTSFFCGVPGQTTIPNLAIGGESRTLRAPSGGSVEVPMTPTRAGFCGFTEFGGRWDGPLEGAWIRPQTINGTEYWTARVNAGSGGEVQVKVRCVAYDQRVQRQPPDDFPS